MLLCFHLFQYFSGIIFILIDSSSPIVESEHVKSIR